jgi:hypothetical protein
VGDDDDVGDVQPSGQQEGKSVADNRADVGLHMGSAAAGLHPWGAPDFNGEEVKGTQQGTRVVDGENRCDRTPLLPIGANGLRTPRNSQKLLHQLPARSTNQWAFLIA